MTITPEKRTYARLASRAPRALAHLFHEGACGGDARPSLVFSRS